MRNDLVLADVQAGVARLTLNDPDRANVLSEAMMTALADALAEAESNPEVRGRAGRGRPDLLRRP